MSPEAVESWPRGADDRLTSVCLWFFYLNFDSLIRKDDFFSFHFFFLPNQKQEKNAWRGTIPS